MGIFKHSMAMVEKENSEFKPVKFCFYCILIMVKDWIDIYIPMIDIHKFI